MNPLSRSTLILIEFDSICVKIVCICCNVNNIVNCYHISTDTSCATIKTRGIDTTGAKFDGSLRLEACVYCTNTARIITRFYK